MKNRCLISLMILTMLLCGCNDSPIPSSTNTIEPGTSTDEIEHLYSVDIPTIAHRGYAIKEVENTADAFIEAGKRNFIGIETDIYFTKDGWIVCNHNNMVDGMKKTIDQCTYDEIMAVDLSRTYDKEVHVCTFNEYLRICKQYNKVPVIEFKTTPSVNSCERVIDVINYEYGDVNNVVFISFGRQILRQMQNLAKVNDYKYKIYRLSQNDSQVQEAIEDKMGINHQWDLLNDDIVKKAKDNNLDLLAWTLNDDSKIKSMIDMGVKYVTTDILECDPKYINK